MKKLLILSLLTTLTLTAMQCCKTDPEPVDPLDLLPPATQTGENTFGCLINGEALVSPNTVHLVAIFQVPTQIEIGGGDLNELGEVHLILNDTNLITEGVYHLIENGVDRGGRGEYIVGIGTNTVCIYDTKYPITGTVEITFLDNTNYIVSGTFQFDAISSDCADTVHITNGRFDIKYIP